MKGVLEIHPAFSPMHYLGNSLEIFSSWKWGNVLVQSVFSLAVTGSLLQCSSQTTHTQIPFCPPGARSKCTPWCTLRMASQERPAPGKCCRNCNLVCLQGHRMWCILGGWVWTILLSSGLMELATFHSHCIGTQGKIQNDSKNAQGHHKMNRCTCDAKC